MKFRYRYFRDKSASGNEYIKLPLLRVRLDYHNNQTDVVGLVDTGAVDCLFDKDVADDLGIRLDADAIQRQYVGIAGESLPGYIHSLKLQVQGFSEWIELKAAFVETKLPFPLLGQTGLFDNYEINFKRYRGRFEIKSRSYLQQS